MKKTKEKNVAEYNRDVSSGGGYIYTNFKSYSAFRATLRQTTELNKMIRRVPDKKLKILDVGCGDGTFTFEIFKKVKPKLIIGFDSAVKAIEVAKSKVNKTESQRIKFIQGNVYNTHKMFSKNEFDVVVVRGVLHHLYTPKKAIDSISKICDRIIILEPNGYNPLLKVIENVSPYHIRHEEKSYFPFWVNKVFSDNKYIVKEKSYFGIIPYFSPKIFVKILEVIEPLIESLPLINILLSGTYLVYYERK